MNKMEYDSNLTKPALKYDPVNFEAHLRVEELADTTIVAYTIYYKLYFRENPSGYIGEQYIKSFLSKHRTIQAKAFLNWLYDYHKVVKELQYKPRKKRRKIEKLIIDKVFSERELVNVETMLTIRDQLIMRLMYEGGLRVSEVLDVRPGHIDRDNMKLKVLRAKGGKQRIINFSPMTQQLFDLHLNNGDYKVDDKIFKITRQRVWQILSKYGKSVLHRKLFPHALRHSCGARLIEADVNLRVIQEYLGHSSPEVTVIYTQLKTEQKDKAWAKAFYQD